MPQSARQKLVMKKLRDAGVLGDYNSFEKNFQASVLNRSEDRGVKLTKGGQFDLSDFPPERTNILVDEIKSLKSRMLKLDRESQQKGIEQTLQETKAKERFKEFSLGELTRRKQVVQDQHQETHREIEREKRSDLPSSKIKDAQRRHEKLNTELFQINAELDRRKKGRFKPVKFSGTGSPA